MATSPLICANDGSMDILGSGNFQATTFGAIPTISTALGGGLPLFGIYRFAPAVPNTTYWLDDSTTPIPEFSIRLPILGLSGVPFVVHIGINQDGTKTGFPADSAPLPASWYLDIQPGAPVGASKGLLAAQKKLTSDPGVTLTIPLDMATFIPPMTDQAWSGSFYINVWITPGGGGTANLFVDDLQWTASGAALLLPVNTVSAPNRDLGRSAGAGVIGPFRRCPITGIALPAERMVPDGFREGILVHPKAYDPPDPDPRPDPGEYVSWGEEAP